MNKRPRVLVVSYNIPRPDKSSGELRFVAILEILAGFWDLDFCVADSHAEWNQSEELIPYIKRLGEIGVNVLPVEKKAFNKAVNENQYAGGYFNLYWIAEEILPLFKIAQPGAFTIVDSVDVHFAREETQAKLGAVEMSKVLETKRRELGVYGAADVTIAVSKDDFALLTQKEGLSNVFLIPNIVKEYPRAPGKRNPVVIFIGCYAWYPNPEAVRWFAELIWPTVHAAVPGSEFLVIGSDPTPEVLALADVPGVKVLGYVPETKPYLEMAAVSVAPLRVGGGMKGKVNEALAHGIPVVATRIGAQGFDYLQGKSMMVSDEPAEFANYVINLLNDDKLQNSMGLAGQKLNSAICSHGAVKVKLAEMVQHCNRISARRSGQPVQNMINAESGRLSLLMQDIGYGFALLKREGIGQFIRRTAMYMNGQRLPEVPEEAVDTVQKKKITLTPVEYELVQPQSVDIPLTDGTPLVSIIIPAYNQWEYTFACLDSIVKNSGSVSFEVILADDNSTDDTRLVSQFVKNIRVIRSEQNLGFLHNCNNAAKSARGEFLLFLNNDTLVQPEWLYWLMKTFEDDAYVGLAGAKFLFPTGELQEAGGVVFRDGSATNYGRFDWPGLSQYSYVKDVDYCSGACICIRKGLWERAGGFDPIYSPGYYEETDLAMQVRGMGYRTVFQPKSVIVHFEGISHGTDLSSGIKSHQPRNQRIFMEKWKHELETNHYARYENLFRARDRSRNKEIILLVDYAVPTVSSQVDHEKYLRIIDQLVRQGKRVIIMPENFYRNEPITAELQHKGVEVLYGGWYRENWWQWIHDSGPNINRVLFIDDQLCGKYAGTLKTVPNSSYTFAVVRPGKEIGYEDIAV